MPDPVVDQLWRIGLKLFLASDAAADPHEVRSAFHRWIQTRAMDQQLLIDVADYAHLHEGPLVVLVAHEGNFALDAGGGRMGLQYYRKQPTDGPLSTRLTSLCRVLLRAATLLENDPSFRGRVRFRGEELELVANDRLLAPNTEEAFAGVQAALEPLLSRLYAGAPCTITRNPDPRERLTVAVKAATPVDLATLAERVGNR